MNPAMNDQALFIGFIGCQTKWAFVISWLLAVLNVNHAVWSPEVLKGVWNSWQLTRELHPWFSHC
jgi:hypothetical protein